MISPRSVLSTFASYSVEEADFAIKIDANEYPEDLPPAVKNKIIERFSALCFNRYPQISALGLRQKIADQFGLKAQNVLLGNGSSQLLASLCFTFADRERPVVYPNPTFSMYGIYARLADSQGAPVELAADFSLDCDELLKTAAQKKAGIILLCNPNNPTGTVMKQQDIEYIVSNSSCPVVIDEAYQEFYGISSVNLLPKYPHLVVARTFSKLYSLASARVGYILSSDEVIAAAAKTVLPYNLNALSLTAAETVMSMKEHFSARIAETAAERQKISGALSKLPGIEVFPSETNFILIRLADAAALAKYLPGLGIGVRDFSGAPGLAGCLRITIGKAEENEAFLKAVKNFKNSNG